MTGEFPPARVPDPDIFKPRTNRMTLRLETRLNVLAWLLMAVIFVIDVRSPTGFAANLLYVAVILFGLWSPRMSFALQLTAASTILSVIAFLLSPAGPALLLGYFNLGISIVVLWVTGIFVSRH